MVCLYPINVKTADTIGPKFCVGPQWAQERFMKDKNFKFLSPPKFDFHQIFEHFENPRNFLLIRELVFVLFYDVHKEN